MKKNLLLSGIEIKFCTAISKILFLLIFQSAMFCYGQASEKQYQQKKSAPFKCITGKYGNSIKSVTTKTSQPKNYDSRTITNVPLQFYVVRPSNGIGGLSVAEVAGELTKLNTYYQNGNIHFFECSPMQYINSDTYNSLEAFSNEDVALMQTYNIANVVNVYFFDTITIDGTEICGYSGMLPYFTDDFVGIVNDCARWGLLTTCHEMGHYLSLLHTQGGVGEPQEFVNGSNCTTTGDFVCDTPADTYTNTPYPPVDNNCNYIGTALDPNSQPFTPLMNNIMSEMTDGVCWTSFTTGQFVRANNCLQNDRFYLQCTGTTSAIEQNAYKHEIFATISSNLLTIKSETEFSNVKIFDARGQLIILSPDSNNNKTQAEFLLPGISSGLYFIHVQIRNQWITRKIVFINFY